MRLTLALSLAALLSFAPPAFAQDGKPDEKQEQPRGPGGGMGGGMDEMPKTIARFLKEQVELTEEQTGKVEGVLREAFRDAMKRMFSRMGQEQPSPEDARKEMEDMRNRVIEKIREVLDEGQKRELEVMVKEFETRAMQWEQQRRSDPGRATWGLFEPDLPSKERLLVKTENALILNEEEKKVILPIVERIHAAKQKLVDGRRQRRRDLDKALNDKAKSDEIKERIDISREKDRLAREELDKATAELKEILTLEQEARLVALGIIE